MAQDNILLSFSFKEQKTHDFSESCPLFPFPVISIVALAAFNLSFKNFIFLRDASQYASDLVIEKTLAAPSASSFHPG